MMQEICVAKDVAVQILDIEQTMMVHAIIVVNAGLVTNEFAIIFLH